LCPVLVVPDAACRRSEARHQGSPLSDEHGQADVDTPHTLGHPHLLTNSGVGSCARTEFTGNHLAGIETHPQLQINTVARFDLLGQLGRRCLNVQRSQAGPKSVVL
jgi:hypothetical protein